MLTIFKIIFRNNMESWKRGRIKGWYSADVVQQLGKCLWWLTWYYTLLLLIFFSKEVSYSAGCRNEIPQVEPKHLWCCASSTSV